MNRYSLCAAAVFLLAAPSAWSQTSREEPGYRTQGDSASYEVRFLDEDLLAPGESAYGQWLKVRGTGPRVGLLRPRTTFVPELLKTAQTF